MAANIVKKLSMKVLCGNVKSIAKPLEKGASVELAKVVGIARGIKTGVSNFGDWTALMGDFVASVTTGEKAGQQFRTGQLFLPDVALNLVLPTVENLGKGEGVELAFAIGITEDEDSAPGYIYNATFLVEPKGSDPVTALVSLLDAPKAPETPAVEDKSKGKETAKA